MSRPDEASPADRLPEDLAEALARAAPRLGGFAGRVRYLERTGSTNDLAARLASAGAEDGTTVVAGAQTAGRGRLGRAWFSPPGAGLYVSTVMRATAAAGAGVTPLVVPSLLTLAVGVALAEAVQGATGLPVEIKWPNDLVVGRRKLGGILAEAFDAGTPGGYVVVGFGLNLGPAAYPPDIAQRATSIEAELGRRADRGLVLAEALAAIDRWRRRLAAGRRGEVLSRWEELAPSCNGAPIRWAAAGGERRGLTAGVADDGALLVTREGVTERIVAGEIVWL